MVKIFTGKKCFYCKKKLFRGVDEVTKEKINNYKWRSYKPVCNDCEEDGR